MLKLDLRIRPTWRHWLDWFFHYPYGFTWEEYKELYGLK